MPYSYVPSMNGYFIGVVKMTHLQQALTALLVKSGHTKLAARYCKMCGVPFNTALSFIKNV